MLTTSLQCRFGLSLSKQVRLVEPRIINRYFARHRPAISMPVPRQEKRLDIVIFGHPNVGKSVLLNCLIEHKIAATAHKRHTTRGEILGFFNHRNVQLAFYDTPGYMSSDVALTHDMKALRSVGLAATSKADVILLCVDANISHLSSKQQDWFADMAKVALENAKQEVILVLNKVDLVEPKTLLLETTRQLVSIINGIKLGPNRADEAALDTTTFMISALENDGVVDLKNYLITLAKHKPWIVTTRGGSVETDESDEDDSEGSDDEGYVRRQKGLEVETVQKVSGKIHSAKDQEEVLLDTSHFTALSPEQIVEEVVLESLLEHTHEEIPYIAKISCKSIKKVADGRIAIGCSIQVDTKSQARIVVGQAARTLVKIRQSACIPLEKMFKVKYILLTLNVETRMDEQGKMKSSVVDEND